MTPSPHNSRRLLDNVRVLGHGGTLSGPRREQKIGEIPMDANLRGRNKRKVFWKPESLIIAE